MSIEVAIKELDGVCEFLNAHTQINSATYNLTHQSLTITIESSVPLPPLKIWLSQIHPRLQKIFDRPIKFELSSATGEEKLQTVPEDTQPYEEVQKKLLGKTSYVFSSFDSKYRLLRVEPDKSTNRTDESYYQANKDISDCEIKNMNHLFHIAAQDHRAEKFVKNVIEININNLSNPDLLSQYAFAFRQIPKQLTNRFVLSLVRVPMDTPTETLNTSIKTFRNLISPVFISLELNHYANDRTKIVEIDLDGLVITAGNPQNKETIDLLRKSNLHQINKEVILLYYTRNWKEIPSIEGDLLAMYMKSKIEN